MREKSPSLAENFAAGISPWRNYPSLMLNFSISVINNSSLHLLRGGVTGYSLVLSGTADILFFLLQCHLVDFFYPPFYDLGF